jgi:hypothetical protein
VCRFDKFCRWPVAEGDVWQVLLRWSQGLLQGCRALSSGGGSPRQVAISCSHFLPHR